MSTDALVAPDKTEPSKGRKAPHRKARFPVKTPVCVVCGYCYSQQHRIIPAYWCGEYGPGNVLTLCPNHHTAWHCVMDLLANYPALTLADLAVQDRIKDYSADKPFWALLQGMEKGYKQTALAMRTRGMMTLWNPLGRSYEDWEREWSPTYK